MSTIDFNEIPDSIRKPGNYFELDTKSGNSSLSANVQKVLLISQSPNEANFNGPEQVFSTGEADTKFVKGSIAAVMVRDAIQANPSIQLYVLAVNDGSGAIAAVRTITFAVTTALGGYITVKINNKSFKVNIPAGATADELATLFDEALDIDNFLPYTKAVTTVNVSLTAVSKGSIGNTVPIEIDNSKAEGASASLAETTPGSGEPDYATELAAAAAERYNVIVAEGVESTNIQSLKTFINTQSGPIEKKACRGYSAILPSSNIASAIAAALAVNDGRFTMPYLRKSTSAGFSIATAFAAVDAGEEDPTKPLNGLVLTGIGVPSSAGDFFTNTEIEAMLYGGLSPIEPDNTKLSAVIVKWATTYTVNSGGSPDPTLLDGQIFKALDYVRDNVVARLDARFPRTKRTQRVLDLIDAEVKDVLLRLGAPDVEVLQNVEDNLDKVKVEFDGTNNNRVNVEIPADIVPGLDIIAGVIKLI